MELDGVVIELTHLLATNVYNNPVTIIAHAMDVVIKHFPTVENDTRKEMVMKVVKAIAAGADGIEGTEDDLFSPSTLSKLKVMLDCDIINNVTETLAEGKSQSVASVVVHAPVEVEQVAVAVAVADTLSTICDAKDKKDAGAAVVELAERKATFLQALFRATCCARPKPSQ
jgi:hypothetical protein